MPPYPASRPIENFRSRIVKLLTSSWLIALILGTVTFIVLDFSQAPYSLKLESANYQTKSSEFSGSTYYDELKAGHGTNRILLANEELKTSHIMIEEPDGTTLDQWNFRGLLTNGLSCMSTGDYDHDGLSEFHVITIHSNKLILNIIEPYDKISFTVRDRIIDSIPDEITDPVIYLPDTDLHDLNGDNFSELILVITGSSEKAPRKIIAYDIKNDSLWCSPAAGNIPISLIITDIDNDGITEITGRCDSPYNFTEGKVPFSDDQSWLFIFNHRLEYKYEPVPLTGKFSTVNPIFRHNADSTSCTIHISGTRNGIQGVYTTRITGFGPNRVILDTIRMIDDQNGWIQPVGFTGFKALTFSDGRIDFMNPDDHITRSVNLTAAGNPTAIHHAAAGWNGFDYCFFQKVIPLEVHFFNRSGRSQASVQLPETANIKYVNWAGGNSEFKRLLISSPDREFIFRVSKNPLRYWQYLILLALILAFYGFIILIRLIQFRQIAGREATRKEILELQLKSVRNQLDPHFTFNALTSLSALSKIGDHEGVDRFISHFSRLLRTHMSTSDQVLVPLRDEIEFVVNYVELQKIRFEGAFDFDLIIPSDINLNFQVPKMLIQTHVENAIKHGLTTSIVHGQIRVALAGDDHEFSITVEDNGVGRGHSPVSAFDSTGRGMKTLERIIASVRQLYGMEIHQEIEDITRDGLPAGTRVRILIS
jgi:hypothetical protein